MDNFQIFVVFHKYLFDECYKHIPDDILYKYFTFIAVNEKIEKKYTLNKYKVINEWELPIYDSTFQERGYNENSAIYHIYINNLHKEYDYIGFFHYDMIFNNNIVDFLQQHLTGKPTLFSIGIYTTCNFYFTTRISMGWFTNSILNYIIDDYEKYYNKSFSKNYLYPLNNTYIIPIEIYEKTMKWVTQLYDKLFIYIEETNTVQFGRVGEIYERIMAYAIGEENLQYIKLNVIHDHKYKRLSC